jgi:hypothetical protein
MHTILIGAHTTKRRRGSKLAINLPPRRRSKNLYFAGVTPARYFACK